MYRRSLSGEVIKPIVQNGFNHHSLTWQEPHLDDKDLEQKNETQPESTEELENTEQSVARDEQPVLPQDNAEDTPIDEAVTFKKGGKQNSELSD